MFKFHKLLEALALLFLFFYLLKLKFWIFLKGMFIHCMANDQDFQKQFSTFREKNVWQLKKESKIFSVFKNKK